MAEANQLAYLNTMIDQIRLGNLALSALPDVDPAWYGKTKDQIADLLGQRREEIQKQIDTLFFGVPQ
jgi:hypothetical protein